VLELDLRVAHDGAEAVIVQVLSRTSSLWAVRSTPTLFGAPAGT